MRKHCICLERYPLMDDHAIAFEPGQIYDHSNDGNTFIEVYLDQNGRLYPILLFAHRFQQHFL